MNTNSNAENGSSASESALAAANLPACLDDSSAHSNTSTNTDTNANNQGTGSIPMIGFPQHVHIYHHHDYTQNYTQNEKQDSKNKQVNSNKKLEEAKESINASVASTMEALQNLFQKHISKLGSLKKIKSNSSDSSGSSESSDSSHSSNSSEENKTDGDPDSTTWSEEVDLGPPQKKMWHGFDGIAVMSFGVLIPSLMGLLTAMSCYQRITLMLLNNPCETLLEILLMAMIPIAIFSSWKFYCKNNYRFNIVRGSLLGIAVGSSLIAAGICTVALFTGSSEFEYYTGTNFSTGFGTIALLSLASCATALYVGNLIRLRMEFASSRRHVIFNIAAGILLGMVAFFCAEAKSWGIRLAEKAAISDIAQERKEGLEWMRLLNSEKSLKMECSDSRSVGIAGFFIPIKKSDAQRLYFTVTGKPFRDEKDENFSSMSDEYLSRHVVGERIPGLKLVRSAINGAVSSNNLTSSIGWTYVFHNDTASPKEARAEIALPPDAVISEFTVWQEGEPIEAGFAATGKATKQDQNVNIGHESTGMISSLGRNRYLMHCYPVAEGKELRVQVTMAVPLKLDTLSSATLTLPRFICSNFSLEGEHNLRLESSHKMLSKVEGLSTSRSPNGSDVIEGNLACAQIEHSPIVINAFRDSSAKTVLAKDPIAAAQAHKDYLAEEARKKAQAEEEAAAEQTEMDGQGLVVMIDGSKGVKQQLEDVKSVMGRRHKFLKKAPAKPKGIEPRFVAQSIEEVTSKTPNRVVVVLDGSSAVKERLPEIKNAFQAIPASVPVSVMVASQEDGLLAKPTPLATALNLLDKVQFVGGQNNLKAVVRAAEVAGQAKGGVVLWVHGAQPALYPDIYIMSPFAGKPSFYEISLDSGETDTLEYFKNHSEISGFFPVLAGHNLTSNMTDFFCKWQPGRRDFQSQYATVKQLPKTPTMLSGRQEKELVLLNAAKTIESLIKQKKYDRAAILALQYKIVTPVSCAVILDEQSAPQLQNAPELQGASNGTIGPQGSDATVIMGVNTAGTVRVNNLANLEALLNIIANLVQLSGLFAGGLLSLHGFFLRGRVAIMGVEVSRFARITIGIGIVILGLATPGLINWFVASARDANLFS